MKVYPRGSYDRLERRRSERLVPCNSRGRMTSESRIGDKFRFDQEVKVVDINFFGCLLKLEKASMSLADHARDCTLYVRSPELTLELLVFDYDDDGYVRCLFKHGNIERAEAFAQVLRDGEYFMQPDAAGQVHKIYG